MSIKLKDCRIYISFWFVTFLAVAAFLDKSGYVWCAVLASFIHELGHIIAMSIKNRLPKNVNIGLFNVSIVDKFHFTRDYSQDVFILLAGSVFNFISAVLMYLLFMIIESQAIVFLLFSNLLVGIFNLLPIYALDGGSILLLFLSLKFGQEKANLFVKLVSFIILIPLAFVGFLILLQSYYNFSLLIISCYLIFLLVVRKEI